MSMSQRLSDEAITSLVNPLSGKIVVHPRRGEPIVPIGRRADGRPIFPIMGGSGEEDDANDDDNSGGDDDDDDDVDDEDDPEGSDKSGKVSKKDSDDNDDRDPQKKIAALEDEKNRHLRRRREAERERDDFRARLEALENKDKPETDLLKKENETLKSTNESLSEDLRSARLQIAFLQDNTYEWHSPGRALKLADLTDVEIDDDGTVNGLKAALDALAKSDPYLVKAKDEKSKDEDKDQPKKTGDKPKSKQKKDDPSDRKTLATKYPGLRR